MEMSHQPIVLTQGGAATEVVTNVSVGAAMNAALAKAREHVAGVVKRSRNDYAGYSYASSEHIMVAAREAMAGTGLAIVPRLSSIMEVGGQLILQREFEITHEKGGTKLCNMSWPIVPGKQRPLDKATASAETQSYAYFLRTLFAMPRLDEDDMDHNTQHVFPHDEPAGSPAQQMLSAGAAAVERKIEALADMDAYAVAVDYVGNLAKGGTLTEWEAEQLWGKLRDAAERLGA